MNRFEEIKKGLLEAIQHENGKLANVTIHKRQFLQVVSYTPEEIKRIRLNAKMTQRVFASVIGVSIKTVEAWESGRNKPDGASRRLIGLIDRNPNFAEDNGIFEVIGMILTEYNEQETLEAMRRNYDEQIATLKAENADQANKIADKDAKLAEQDALIAELKAQLAAATQPKA